MKRKLNFNIKGFLNKKENVAIMTVAAVFCAGLVVTEMKAGDIPLHDGDVLVDSRNIAQVEERTDPAETEDGAAGEENSDGQKTAAGEAGENGDTFAEKRAKLELERNDLIAKYEDTIKNSTNEAEKKNAISQKSRITKYMEQELSLESLISSKNLPDCLVIITESGITVTVDEQDLNQNMVAKICSLVMEETGRTADKIIIQSQY